LVSFKKGGVVWPFKSNKPIIDDFVEKLTEDFVEKAREKQNVIEKQQKEIESNYPIGSFVEYLGERMLVINRNYHDNPSIVVQWMDGVKHLQTAVFTRKELYIYGLVSKIDFTKE
jgi:uncharacterized protein YycO